MKRTICKLLIFIFSIVSLFTLSGAINAKNDLDKINKYVITVDPNFDDGSLDIRINISWKVLDSSSEGPLEWVKIGVPNYHAENITPLTNNIKKASYYSDDGSFIRIDFDKKYYANEVVDFSFSFNQSYMYHIYGDDIYYDYHPGYFNDIIVDNCILKWKNTNVTSIEKTSLDYQIIDDYITYQAKLNYGNYININVKYNKTSFINIDPEKTYTDQSEKYPWLMPTLIFGGMALLVLLSFVIKHFTKDPYKSERGFTVMRPYYFFGRPIMGRRYSNGGVTKEGKAINPPKSVGGGHGGGGCACACACAGGGRAGCSMKDFYHTNIKSKDLKDALNK